MTRFEEWRTVVKTWSDCKKCAIGSMSCRKVMGRGALDSPVMFLGEAPGKSEDVVGQPFIGPAGRLLNKAIQDAGGNPNRCFFTNLIACRPTELESGPNRPPLPEEVEACRGRLDATIALVKPKSLVSVGFMARKFVEDNSMFYGGFKTGSVLHPASILRKGGENAPDYPDYVRSLRRVL